MLVTAVAGTLIRTRWKKKMKLSCTIPLCKGYPICHPIKDVVIS